MGRFFKTVFIAGVLTLTTYGSGNGEDMGAFPQFDFQFYQITTDDGLSQLNVQVIYQDKYGFMWMGTENGLNRFDGYEFKVYDYNPDDPHSLNHNHILSLYEDSRGDFWVGTLGGGLHLYDRDRDRFERIVGDPDDWRSLSDNSIWTITEDHLGNIWIGTSYGLNLLHREDFSTDKYFYDQDNPESLSDFDVNVVYEDSRKNLWVGTNDGLNLMDREKGTFTRFKHDPDNPNSISSNQISTIFEDSHGVLWIGTLGGGLNYLDYETNTFVSYTNDVSDEESIYDNFVHAVMEDSEGLLWVGMGAQGLNIFDRENEQFHLIGPDPESGSEYALSGINSIYESRENILWVGSYSGSIHYMDRKLQFFSNISPIKHSLSGLGDDRVRSFAQAQDGKIWFGTDGGGLGLYNPATGKVEAHRHDPDNKQSIPGDIILALHKNEGELWLGSYGRGLSRLDLDTWEFRHFRNDPSDPGSLSSNDVYCIFEDSDGDLWVGTNRGGLNRLKPGADSFIRYMVDPEDPESILNNDVRSVFEDRRGNLWVGSYSGFLSRFDKQTNRFIHHDINYGAKYYSSVIQVFLEDGEGRFWLGTRSAGLQKFDRDREEIVAVYGVDQGLAGNIIQGMIEDDNGIIWVSTENGITRFDPDTGHIQNFDEYSGFMDGEFIPASYFKDENGTLYFGGVDGFSRFHPDEIDLTDHEHPVVFTDFLISNRSVSIGAEESPLQKQIHLTEELVIPYLKASHLTFRFSALNFSPKKNNQFAYMLEGFDNDWNYVGSQRMATYTNLNPGEYVLRVMATNNNGIWPENSTEIALVITPPFWRTAWFILLGVVFVGAMIVFIFKLRVYKLNERRRELERLVEERTAELQISNSTKNKLFSIIAHDLNNLAFGMYGFIELLQEGVENNNMSEVKEYTTHLHQVSGQYHDLLENLLTWARSQSEGFEHRPEMIQLAELVEEHMQQLRSRAQQKSIRLQTSVDSDLEVYADRNMLSTVFRNLLHNSLKFTKAGGWVEIASDMKEDVIEVSVIDNGIGMSQEQLEKIRSSGESLTTKGTQNEIGTGLGLMLCKDFIAQNGGSLIVESKKNEGSRFSFTLPRGPEVVN